MNMGTKDDWLIAEVLADEVECFVLWMIDSGLCLSRDAFERNFKSEVAVNELVDRLKQRGFVDEQGAALGLTKLGQATIEMIREHASTLGQTESISEREVSGSRAFADAEKSIRLSAMKAVDADEERASSRETTDTRFESSAVSTRGEFAGYKGANSMINAHVLQGQWNQVRGQLKKKWGELTEDDLRFTNGNVDQLIGRIQQKTGEAREAVESVLEDLVSLGGSTVSQAAEAARSYARYEPRLGYDDYNRISDEIGRHYEASYDLIRARPGQSVAVAFGAGMLVGVVLGLALRSR